MFSSFILIRVKGSTQGPACSVTVRIASLSNNQRTSRRVSCAWLACITQTPPPSSHGTDVVKMLTLGAKAVRVVVVELFELATGGIEGLITC